MGLDGVEIIMELEEQFHISISDEDAQQMRTAGDIHDYLVGRMEREKRPGILRERCRSQFLFYRLRQAIAHTCGHLKKEIRPESNLDFLVAKKERQKIWLMISEHSGLRLPLLERPDWLVLGGLLVAGIIFVAKINQIISTEWPMQNPIYLAKSLGTILLGIVTIALI